MKAAAYCVLSLLRYRVCALGNKVVCLGVLKAIGYTPCIFKSTGFL